MDAGRDEEFSVGDDGKMDIVDDDAITEDELEDRILLADDYRAANSHGTTQEEAREGESLAGQLSQEEPDTPDDWVDDTWRDGPGPQAGQLVSDGPDMADESGRPDDDAPDAEESAVHLTDEDDDRDAQLSDAGPGESLDDAERFTDLDQTRDAERDDYR